MRTLIIGSRASELALMQSNLIRSEILSRHPGVKVEIKEIKTTGDKILDAPLSKIGDKGLFIKELDSALQDGSIDLAVHSLKDVPTAIASGTVIAIVTKRADVRDAFVSHPAKSYKSLSDVPVGGTIATGSLRRRCQLLSWRSDLNIAELRGNVGTRLSKLDASTWDGILLAGAGLTRLGLEKRIAERIDCEQILPAVGQGALAVTTRDQDVETRKLLSHIHSEATFACTSAERALLRTLEGGCQIPIGAYGRIEENVLYLDAMVGSLDGKSVVRGSIHGTIESAERLGVDLANILVESGAKKILDAVRSATTSVQVPAHS
jgi:hydroxymethylbilane synthase